ncbi:aldehyde oxidase GLOX-like [Malania oleifera]|uniref:aldehyde oxidase GLOX-like n=1 Tax=Malania oleifera TaxID=397392 RepID=UPI0025AEADF8|nr:aldehyde oxidase GLOX-like [Malania oleifera]
MACGETTPALHPVGFIAHCPQTNTNTTSPPLSLSLSLSLLMTRYLFLSLLLCHLLCAAGTGGRWTLLHQSIGITSMHMQLLYNDRVVMYDRTDFGISNISLPGGKCRHDPYEAVVKVDCSAHSVEYDVPTNTFRPLMVQTDVWCSSGALAPDGSLVQAGGFNDGERVVRIFQPCNDSRCDWREIPDGLAVRRWYATSQALPNGTQIIFGGRRQFNYEFYPKAASTINAYSLRFLVETFEKKAENNLYPFVFLNVDGNLFIFANNRAILFNYKNGTVVRTYPIMPGGDPRSYPSTGSSALLPLKLVKGGGATTEAEVLICGGAPKGAYFQAQNGTFAPALNTCGRIKITDPSPKWVMETMPMARVMGDMILLPNGDVLIINGAAAGTAGWEFGRDPVLKPVIYRPDIVHGSRFEVQNPSCIPRMYHSSAVLVRDGRVLVGGSNPHIYYNFTGVLYPTDLSLEAFSPPYLDAGLSGLRPRIVSPVSQAIIEYGRPLSIQFCISGGLSQNGVSVTMIAPSFTTHSFAMNQRLLVLGGGKARSMGNSTFKVRVVTPGSGDLAPSGYYMVYVVHQGVPSEGIWVHIR